MVDDFTADGTRARPFWHSPEWVITIVAVIASVGALVLGAYTAQLQRRHDSASVWPHLEIGITFTSTVSGMQLSNSGIGPAVVQSVRVSVDGHPMRSWHQVFSALLDVPVTRFNSSSVSERVIRAGETVNWFSLPSTDLPPDIQARLARVAIVICYASIYDQHWTLSDSHAGGHSVSREVDRCPPAGDLGEEF